MPERLRVLLLSTSYPLRPTSSSGIFVRRLADALGDLCDVTVLCPADDVCGPLDAGSRVKLVPFRYAPERWQRLAQTPGGVLPAMRAQPVLLLLLPCFLAAFLAALLRRARRCDAIHANWALSGALAAVIWPVHRRPIVLTLRGDDVSMASRSSVHRLLLRVALHRASQVVCVAHSMAQNLRASFPVHSHKTRVILNGVDLVHSSEGRRSHRILFVGSLIPRKGADVLLRAFARLEPKVETLRLIGDGPERTRLVELARALAISDRVEFAGQVPPHEVAGHLAESEVFVLPSLSEGRPNVLLEAMAAGVAVVATEIDGVRETVADGVEAWLVPPGDPDALANALGDALARPEERLQRAKAARRRIDAQGWTWSAAARAYADVFTAAVVGQSPSRCA